MSLSTLDRYLLGQTARPMIGVLGATTLAFLLERLLRLLDGLSQSNNGFGALLGLTVNLVPHFVGLTLPAAFFITLFIVFNRLSQSSEIDVLLASGVSLSRIAAPFVALGLLLTLASLLLYGFAQPYSRYGYRAVLQAAENAGWNGQVQAQALVSPSPDLVLTADGADPSGRKLERVFIRRLSPDGREVVTTAAAAELRPSPDRASVTLLLRSGQQLISPPRGATYLLTFETFSLQIPLTAAAKLLEPRGQDEGELTLLQLAREGFQSGATVFPRQTLLADLYARLARSLALPLMPLLALPLALSAKRAGAAPAMTVAGLLLFAFQYSLQFGQSLAASGHATAAAAEGWPMAIFASSCLVVFITSRKRPGENPVGWLAERMSELLARVLRRPTYEQAHNPNGPYQAR